MAKQDEQPGLGTVTKTKPKEKVQQPPLYRVLLHNDDYTTMEFVVWILESVFHHDETTATRIMLHVHRNGIGIAGVYAHEIAEVRASRVETLAREHEYPLRCTVEAE